MSVALGQDPGGKQRAGHDPGVRYLLPFRRLIGVIVRGGGEAVLGDEEGIGGGGGPAESSGETEAGSRRQ